LRTIDAATVTEVVARLCEEANFNPEQNVHAAFQRAYAEEISPLGKDVLSQILANAAIAAEHRLPICQDTGIVLVLIDLGQEAQISGGEPVRSHQSGRAKGLHALSLAQISGQ